MLDTWNSYQARFQNCEIVWSVRLSIRMAQLDSHWTDFHENWCFRIIFENQSRKFKFHRNLTRILGILHEDPCPFTVVFRWILLRMKNISDKICRENQNTFSIPQLLLWNSCHLWDNAKKLYSRTGHRRQHKAHALCMLNKCEHSSFIYIYQTAVPANENIWSESVTIKKPTAFLPNHIRFRVSLSLFC